MNPEALKAERTRLIAWLAVHELPVANAIDREITADALMSDFVVPARTTQVTPAMIAAAWGAWRVRHKGKMGPGPAFREAIQAALDAARQQRGVGHDNSA